MTRPIIGWVFILAVGCGAASPGPTVGAGVAPAEEPGDEEDDPESFTVALRLEEAEPGEGETPRTRVALVLLAEEGGRTVVELEREVGACYHEAAPADAMIAARCWWGSSGAVYVVRREGDAIIARRAAAEGTGPPADFAEAGRVEVPDDGIVQVLGGDVVAAPR